MLALFIQGTAKHIDINIHCHGCVIDSIINPVIFMTGFGASNDMTSIIFTLKLHSLCSPFWLCNASNHFSWEFFCFFSNLLILC